jgi:hypothetical protein
MLVEQPIASCGVGSIWRLVPPTADPLLQFYLSRLHWSARKGPRIRALWFIGAIDYSIEASHSLERLACGSSLHPPRRNNCNVPVFDSLALIQINVT